MAGTVMIASAISGATVQLWSPTGALIATATTDQGGFFNFTDLGSLPRDFVVSATGGTYLDEPFRGTLLLVRDDYGDTLEVLSVNLLSTVAARVLETAVVQRQAMTPAQAVARTRSYFGLSSTYDIGTLRSPSFDPTRFLITNPPSELDQSLADAARTAVGTPDAVQAYPERLVRLSGTDLAVTGGVTVLKYGFNWLKQYDDPFSQTVSSWGMAALSLVTPPDYTDRFNRIDQALDGLKNQLDDLSNRVIQMESRLNDRFKSVEAGLDRLENTVRFESYKSRYATAATAMAAPKAQIDALHRVYMTYIKAPYGQVTARQWDELASEIRLKVPPAILTLKNLQTGVGSGSQLNSAIRNWHLIQAMTSTGYPTLIGSDFYEALNQQEDYVISIQLLGVNLLIEAYNYESVSNAKPATRAAFAAARSPLIPALLKDYEAELGQQQAMVAPRVDPGLITDVYNGRTFVRTLAAFPKPAAPDALGSYCSVVSMQWTERTVTGIRSIGEGRRQTDCGIPLSVAMTIFNSATPFGWSDWTLGTAPGFLPRDPLKNYDLFKASGFDMGSYLRLGYTEAQIRDNGLVFGFLPGLLLRVDLGTSTNTFGMAGSSFKTEDMFKFGGNPLPLLVFSRPSAVDPATAACKTLPASGAKPLRIDCSLM